MNETYFPNEKIVDRAVSIWIKLLKQPMYDNGDKSDVGVMTKMLAHSVPSNVTDEILIQFGIHLKNALMTKGSYQLYPTSLNVDYSPDKTLSDAAEKAGLCLQFPWKTSMFIDKDRVGISGGYGSSYVVHYPLSNGKWLMTTLTGDKNDVDKLIKIVEDGAVTCFKVED